MDAKLHGHGHNQGNHDHESREDVQNRTQCEQDEVQRQ